MEMPAHSGRVGVGLEDGLPYALEWKFDCDESFHVCINMVDGYGITGCDLWP